MGKIWKDIFGQDKFGRDKKIQDKIEQDKFGWIQTNIDKFEQN